MIRQIMMVVAMVIIMTSSAFAGDWRYNTVVYDSENLVSKELEISYSVEQDLSPALIWSVKKTLDEFILERGQELNNLNALYTTVKERLEARGITGFQIVAVGIQDANTTN